MILRRLRKALPLALAMVLTADLTAKPLTSLLQDLKNQPKSHQYGEAPWVAGVPEGYQFSRPGNPSGTISKSFAFNPAGFVILMIAAAILKAATGGNVRVTSSSSNPPRNVFPPPGTGTGSSVSPGVASKPQSTNSGGPSVFGLTPGGTPSAPPTGPVAAPSKITPVASVQGAVPPSLAALGTITSASQIDDAKAKAILTAGGYFTRTAQAKKNSGTPYQKALKALSWGWTFKKQRRNLTLNSTPRRGKTTVRNLVFEEYQRMTKAYSKYSNLKTLSAKATPKEFNQLVQTAANGITWKGNPSQKFKLITAQLDVESFKRHWTDHKLTRSFAGAGGAGQIMPGHSLGKHGKGMNYYDPADGFKLHVLILNDYLRSSKGNLRNALAKYNGGPGAFRRSGPQAYARKIMRKAGL